MDWQSTQHRGVEQSGLPPAIGVKPPGSIPDSVDTTTLFFNESVKLCKRELRNLSISLQEEAIEILRQEAHLILNDVCAQVVKECGKCGKDCAKNGTSNGYVVPSNGAAVQVFAPAVPPPLTMYPHGDLKNTADLHIDYRRPYLSSFDSSDGVAESLIASPHSPQHTPQRSDMPRHNSPMSPQSTDMPRLQQSDSRASSKEIRVAESNRPHVRVSAGGKRWSKQGGSRHTVSARKQGKEWAKEFSETYKQDPSKRSSVSNDMYMKMQHRLSVMQGQKVNEFKRSRIGKCVTSDAFDYVFGLILVLNALAMGVQADWEGRHLGDPTPSQFAMLDVIFCLAFLLELALRLHVFKVAYYFMPGWQWAYFDTVIVSMQAFEEIIKLVELIRNEDDGGSDQGGGIFKVLKLLKVGRLLRMVRMVRLIPELKSMVYLIFASMGAFFWSLVLLTIMIYAIAVYLTMMATDVLVEKGIEATEDLQAVHLYWGSVGDSIMSLYWSITGGQDWGDLIQPLVNETEQPLHNVIFAMYIAFATMVVMNLVTGVFVEGAQRLTKEDKDREVVKMAFKTFNAVDEDDSFAISEEELATHMESGNMDSYLDSIGLERQECLDLFKLLDVDNSGSISLQEFTQGCLKLRGQARAADVAQLLVDVREVKEEVAARMEILNGSYKSVLDMMSMWSPSAYDLGCEV